MEAHYCSSNHSPQTSVEADMAFGRQSVQFQPSVWGDYFITHPDHLQGSNAKKELRAEELRISVKSMFKETDDVLEKMKLIDSLQRLGLDYRFKEEISEALSFIHSVNVDHHDLHTTALHFRLLRQQAYNVPSDVFKKFKDGKGNFKESLSGDAKALFSLYEATFLATKEDQILDEARAFARVHLEMIMPQMESSLRAQTKLALETPFFRGIRRLEARYYISIYGNDDEAHNPQLLELAKIDYNLLQLLHRAELASISKWWKDVGFVQKFTFARDRLVEGYFWTSGVFFEPQHSQAKILLTKFLALITIMDDLFDVYGTIEELQKFTDVFQRWELHDVAELPEYMQVYIHEFARFVREVEETIPSEERVTCIHFLKKVIKAQVASYFQEAKWASKGYKPTLEEYLNVSAVSGTYPMFITASVIFSGDKVSKEGLVWLTSLPKSVEGSSLIARILDDTVSAELEKEREHVATSVECYMNDHAVSEEEAREKLQEIVEKSWKDMNEVCLQTPRPLELSHLTKIIDFARVPEVVYKHGDGYTFPGGRMKDHIALLFVDPIPA